MYVYIHMHLLMLVCIHMHMHMHMHMHACVNMQMHILAARVIYFLLFIKKMRPEAPSVSPDPSQMINYGL